MSDWAKYKTFWSGVDWPAESYRCERRFNHPVTRLYPFLKKRVITPRGEGVLKQVFDRRVVVVLDANKSRLELFQPWEIRPMKKTT